MKQYVVDAFSDKVFHGNPAAICVTDAWLPDETMMRLAEENNLSETAFAVKEDEQYRLRWFTPGGEIDLCGHATLAAAYVILRFYQPEAEQVAFRTASGILTVKKTGDLYEMRFPAYALTQVPVTAAMTEALGAEPAAAYMGRDLLCVFDSPETVLGLRPDMAKVSKLEGLLLHATARGTDTDCLSRTFAPKLLVNEDPVCGSGHCHIIPYWASTLNKQELVARQASRRGGILYCRKDGDRVFLAGKAALFSQADIFID